jgi:solute carrier family 15 oligopeptide transporter 1
VGCGCIKGNTNVFGGNQHKLPEEARQLQIYFSAQYFALKCGSFLARFTYPIMKDDVKCFGGNDCYLLAFGVATIFVGLAVITLISGSSHYIHVQSNGNMLLKVFNCIKVNMNNFLQIITFNSFIFSTQS